MELSPLQSRSEEMYHMSNSSAPFETSKTSKDRHRLVGEITIYIRRSVECAERDTSEKFENTSEGGTSLETSSEDVERRVVGPRVGRDQYIVCHPVTVEQKMDSRY
jgi:hypothetical protein